MARLYINQAGAKLPVPPVMTKVFPLKASVIVFMICISSSSIDL